MLILTSGQKTALLNAMVQLGVSSASPFDAANALNAPSQTANSATPTVPVPFTVAQIVTCLSMAATVALSKHQIVNRYMDCIGAARTNLADFGNYCGGFVKDGTFTTADYSACMAIANATHSDPNWPPMIFGPSVFDTITKSSPIMIDNIPYHFCTEQIIIEARS